MAKWYGMIGYSVLEEKTPGVWMPTTVEKEHYGDIYRNVQSNQSANQTNDNIVLNSQIRIVASPYAQENFQFMKYAVYKGTKWKITSIDHQYPCMILTLGGVYNDNGR